MAKRQNPFISLVALGFLAIFGIAGGLGLAGAFDSGTSSPSSLQRPSPTPTPTPAPEATESSAPSPNPAPKATETPIVATTPVPASSPIPASKPAKAPPPAGSEVPAHAPSEAPKVEGPIALDPDFERALSRAGISQRGWKTDFSLHTVPYEDILSGGPPRDGIPPKDNPQFTTTEDASRWLGDQEPVIIFGLNGDVRAYPLQILTWHEIVNDMVGGVPVAVTFCPLCNATLVFDRTLDGVVYDFGTSGKLRNSDLIMWDRQTESWWQQFTGEGIVGELAGKKLTSLPSQVISWEDFKAANPQGKVLSRQTGFARSYGQNPYAGYDRADNPPFLYDGDLDGRLLPKERVVFVTVGEETVAFPFSIVEVERAVNYTVNGKDLVVFFDSGTLSALDSRSIARSRDVGATGVFDPNLDGRTLTFRIDGEVIVDNETRSVWSILGKAIEGPLTGKELAAVVHDNNFWFAVAAFKPDTKIYQGAG